MRGPKSREGSERSGEGEGMKGEMPEPGEKSGRGS